MNKNIKDKTFLSFMETIPHASPPSDLGLDKIVANAELISKHIPWNGFNNNIKPYLGGRYNYFTRSHLDADWTRYSDMIMQSAEAYIEFAFMNTPQIEILLGNVSAVPDTAPIRIRLNLKRNNRIYFIEDRGIYVFQDFFMNPPKEHLIVRR